MFEPNRKKKERDSTLRSNTKPWNYTHDQCHKKTYIYNAPLYFRGVGVFTLFFFTAPYYHHQTEITNFFFVFLLLSWAHHSKVLEQVQFFSCQLKWIDKKKNVYCCLYRCNSVLGSSSFDTMSCDGNFDCICLLTDASLKTITEIQIIHNSFRIVFFGFIRFDLIIINKKKLRISIQFIVTFLLLNVYSSILIGISVFILKINFYGFDPINGFSQRISNWNFQSNRLRLDS